MFLVILYRNALTEVFGRMCVNFPGKKRFLSGRSGKGDPAAWDGDCSLLKAQGRSSQLFLGSQIPRISFRKIEPLCQDRPFSEVLFYRQRRWTKSPSLHSAF